MDKFDIAEHERESRKDYKLKIKGLKNLSLSHYEKYLETGDKAELLLATEFAHILHVYLDK